MSGGQRSLREDPTSYRATGIPCGNPKRYASRGIIRMAPDGRPFQDQRLEVPQEAIETEGDRQLKQLVQQQLETNVTVHGTLKRKKQFEAVTVYKPATAEVSGTVSLSQYQSIEEYDHHVQALRQCGLTEDEICLKLETEGLHPSGQVPKRKRYGADPQAHASRLEVISKKIEAKRTSLDKPDSFAGARYMSRQEMDIEKSISHDEDKKRVLGMLITSEKPKTDFDDPNDPINSLGSILEEFKQKIRKKKRKNRCKNSTAAQTEINRLQTDSTPTEVSEISLDEKNNSDTEETSVATCEPRPKVTGPFIYVKCSHTQIDEEIKHSVNETPGLCRFCGSHLESNRLDADFSSGQSCAKHHTGSGRELEESSINTTREPSREAEGPRLLQGNVESIPADVIGRYKLTVDKIREQTRFKDYMPGLPSKTLFLKNLSPQVTEEDLVSLFIRFENPGGQKIVFRLMRGKMKGQAFVMFDSEAVASEALELVSGYDFRGKPIIIQYGKRTAPHVKT